MFDLHLGGQHAQLEKVIAHTRQRYADVAGQCAESLTEALALADFEVEGAMRQDEVYRKQVRSRAGEGKTTYILVDALRYEMVKNSSRG